MKNPVIILLVVILIAVLALGTFTVLGSRKKSEEANTPPTPKSTPTDEVIEE